jgi:hypothetical protein
MRKSILRANYNVERRRSLQRLIEVFPSSRAVKVANPTGRYHDRLEVICIDAAGIEKAILPVIVVGYAAARGTAIIETHPLVPRISYEATARRLDADGCRSVVGPQGSVSAADGAIAGSKGARKAADVDSNGAAVAGGSWENGCASQSLGPIVTR